MNRYVIQKGRDQQVVLYWYQSQGQVVKSAFARNLTDGAIVRVISPVYGNTRETSERLVAYVQAMYPVLGDYLPN